MPHYVERERFRLRAVFQFALRIFMVGSMSSPWAQDAEDADIDDALE